MFRRIRIETYQCGFCFHKDEFVKLLGPGVHRIVRPWRTRVEIIDQLETRFEYPRLNELLGHAAVREKLEVVELGETERALTWKEERLAYILGPGCHALWKAPWRLTIERFDVRAAVLRHPRAETVLGHPDASFWLRPVDVVEGEELRLVIDGRTVDVLGPGRHLLWRARPDVALEEVCQHRAAQPAVETR